MNSFLLQNAAIRPVSTAQIAGTSAVNGSAVDTANVESVVFVAVFGTAAAGNTIKVQQSDDSGGSPDDFTDLAGTSVTVGASDEVVSVEVKNPQKRYLRAVAVRGTSTTLDAMLSIQSGFRSTESISNAVAGTIASEASNSPAEGTA